MAYYSHFTTENKVWGKPESWKDEDCGALPTHTGITKLPSGQSVPFITSFWKFTPEELAEINRSGGTYVTIITPILSPMSVSAFDPVPGYLRDAKKGITSMVIDLFNRSFNCNKLETNVVMYRGEPCHDTDNLRAGGVFNLHIDYPVSSQLQTWFEKGYKRDIPYDIIKDGVSEKGILIGCSVRQTTSTGKGVAIQIAFDHAKPEGIEL